MNTSLSSKQSFHITKEDQAFNSSTDRQTKFQSYLTQPDYSTTGEEKESKTCSIPVSKKPIFALCVDDRSTITTNINTSTPEEVQHHHPVHHVPIPFMAGEARFTGGPLYPRSVHPGPGEYSPVNPSHRNNNISLVHLDRETRGKRETDRIDNNYCRQLIQNMAKQTENRARDRREEEIIIRLENIHDKKNRYKGKMADQRIMEARFRRIEPRVNFVSREVARKGGSSSVPKMTRIEVPFLSSVNRFTTTLKKQRNGPGLHHSPQKWIKNSYNIKFNTVDQI